MIEEDEFFGPVISKYTAKDAVEDGIFVEVEVSWKESCVLHYQPLRIRRL